MEELLKRRCIVSYYIILYTKRVWEVTFREVLTCESEPDNASDRYTVAVMGKSISDVEIVANRLRNC
jgi:hypothetical protein